MWVIEDSITPWCRIDIDWWICPIVKVHTNDCWYRFIYLLEGKKIISYNSDRFYENQDKNLWHPLYIGRVMNYIKEKYKANWARLERLKDWTEFYVCSPIEIWDLIKLRGSDLSIPYSELSEESQDKILDLLLRVYEWQKNI